MGFFLNIFSPQIFWPIIGVISIGFILVVAFSIIGEGKSKKKDEDMTKRLELFEKDITEKDAETKNLKDKYKAKEGDYCRQLTKLEEQISENEANRAKINSLEAELKQKDASSQKDRALQEGFDKKTKEAQLEIEKAKKEATLKLEMYNGLKSQYDELETQMTAKVKELEEAIAN